MLSTRAPSLLPILPLLAVLGCIGCDPGEKVVLLKARVEGDRGTIDSVQVIGIPLSGRRAPTRSAWSPNRRSIARINGLDGEPPDPIRITAEAPSDIEALVQVRARGSEGEYVATRCYSITGVMSDEILLVRIEAGADADGDFFLEEAALRCLDPAPVEGDPPVDCDFMCPVETDADCDPNNATIFPGAPEICANDLDEDCDGVDAECEDADGDGFITCSPGDSPTSCDCDDGNSRINPDVEERCGNGADENCNGLRDDLCDNDGDGFRANQPVGGAPDCDDRTADELTDEERAAGYDPSRVFPGATEECDGIDNNCNGLIDERSECAGDDLDRDGQNTCSGGATTGCDCNDCDPGINTSAREVCGNTIDENCDGVVAGCAPGDGDGDGYLAGDECDDTDPLTNPGAIADRCEDDTAQNCIADVSCAGDTDMDDWVEPAECEGNDLIVPGTTDRGCNSVDDNCDGIVDEIYGRRTTDYPESFGCVLGDLGAVAQEELCTDPSVPCRVDYADNIFHCGGCRVSCINDALPPDSQGADRCIGAACDCTDEPGLGACMGGMADACCPGSGCTDLLTDFNHCGLCATACDPAKADQCLGGACVCGDTGAACSSGQTCCGGACVDMQIDSNNCGECGRVCQQNSTCGGGLCNCAGDFQDCNGDRNRSGGDGCETDLANDDNNCDSCGRVCMTESTISLCIDRLCEVAGCGAGLDDCDRNASNGCEAPLNTLTSCGSCGTMCSRANATATCATRSCRVGACNDNWGNCDNMDANGCETPLGDVVNCSSCGNACTVANGTPVCNTVPTVHACQIGMCNFGFEDCDGLYSNGCERNLMTDSNNCGGCGLRCGSNATCVSGTCRCDVGSFDCNMDIGRTTTNGCETANGPGTCGSCTHACGPSEGCNSVGQCTCGSTVGSALMGEACGGAGNECCSDVCTDTNNNENNCGACGALCELPGTFETCDGGSCVTSSCPGGTGDCDGIGTNGCETPLGTNMNCASCGNACGAANGTAACSTGTCRLSGCNAGFADCDATYANGCEANLNTDASHCGTCGVRCNGGSGTCSGGLCQCTSSSQCPGSLPNCVGGVCVAPCTNRSMCGGSIPACDTGTGLCVRCIDDTDCGGATPVCNTMTHLCM